MASQKDNDLILEGLQPTFYKMDNYHEKLPSNTILQKYVSCFYEIMTYNQHFHSIPVVPDGCMDIIFIINNDDIHSYVLRTAQTLLGMDIHENRYVLGIRFKPVGISKFIRFSSADNDTYMIPLCEYLHADALSVHKLFELSSFEHKCDFLENILLKNIGQDTSSTTLTFDIANYIIANKGIITIDQLSSEYYYSQRYINRLFNNNVGISPKHFCEIIQLQNVLSYLTSSDDKIAAVAAHTGFYDQSHMNHVIKKLLHTTSTKLRTNPYLDEVRDKLDIKYIY